MEGENRETAEHKNGYHCSQAKGMSTTISAYVRHQTRQRHKYEDPFANQISFLKKCQTSVELERHKARSEL